MHSIPLLHLHRGPEAALLTLEFAPERARRLFRHSLRSPVPHNRLTAAAALATLDEPWCRVELLAVLNESCDQEATAECRAALLASRSPDLHRLVEVWETQNPHERDARPCMTIGELMLRDRNEMLQAETEMLHDRVLPLRRRISPESNPG